MESEARIDLGAAQPWSSIACTVRGRILQATVGDMGLF